MKEMNCKIIFLCSKKVNKITHNRATHTVDTPNEKMYDTSL